MAHLKNKFKEFHAPKNVHKFLSLIPTEILKALIEKYQADKWVQSLFTHKLIKLHLLMHLVKPRYITLRAIVRFSDNLLFKLFTGLNRLSPNGLSKANKDLDYHLFADLFGQLLLSLNKKTKKRFLGKIKIFDTTFLMLSLKLSPWSARCNGKGCVKLGLRIDDGSTLPNKVAIDTKSTNDNNLFAEMIDFDLSGITYLFDRGFYTIEILERIQKTKNFFITRLSPHYPPKADRILKDLQLPEVTNHPASGEKIEIIKDQIIHIGSKRKQSHSLFRLITAQPQEGETLFFLTNRFDLPAIQVCEWYKHRWQIEILFKWLKQYLKINQFISRSENGVMTQIYMTLIFHLLLILYRDQTKRTFAQPGKSKVSLLETLSQLENQIMNDLIHILFYQGILLGWWLALPLTPSPRRKSRTLKSWGQ